MTDEGNPNPDEGTVDLVELVGSVLDSRGLTSERISKLDSLDGFGEDFRNSITSALAGATKPEGDGGQSFDKEAFLGEIGSLIDGKLAALGTGTPTPKKRGALLAWLYPEAS